eukprot:COSAG01_NODE_6964_length_3414_cov_11.188235_4_plen_83_part_00
MEAAELARRAAGEMPADWEAALSAYASTDSANATRKWSQFALNELCERTRAAAAAAAVTSWRLPHSSAAVPLLAWPGLLSGA